MLPVERHFARSGDPLAGAFVERSAGHWVRGRPVPVPDAGAAFASLVAAKRPGRRAAYLHVPFCSNHCLYCGFYRNRADEDALAVYTAYVERQIARDAEAAKGFGPVHAVYFGGGTPNALAAEDLHRLIRAVRSRLALAPDCEITVEGRVFGFTPEKIDACLAAGANRFSIGVQTFDTDLRRRFGRKAEREEAVEFLRALRERDAAAVVCDLIYGLPGQDIESWRRDLRTCIELDLDGVDLYALTLFDKGPLALSIAKGALPAAASQRELAEFYAVGLEMLEDAGWRHLTQAHWGSGTRERNLYNQFVKSGADCLAFGSGAGGMLGGHRYMLDGDCEAYQRRVMAGDRPIAMMLAPQPHQRVRDLVTAGLEAGRLDLARLEAAAAPGLSKALAPLVDQWAGAGLVRRRADSIVLTTAGWFWHGNLGASLNQLISLYLGGTPGTEVRHVH
ncbi:MAG TPA: heme anaerobic degradation radical SAM methyltransferase ChuW/HutW [Rhizomicrobium sp.]